MVDFDFFDNPDISEEIPDIDSPQSDYLDFSESGSPVLEDYATAPVHTESFVTADDFVSLQSTVKIENYVNTGPITENSDSSSGDLKNPEPAIDNYILAVDNTPLSVDDTGLSIDNETDSIHSGKSQVSFGSKYNDAEISRMKDDVSKAEYEVSCRKNDVSNWESKVSLNDTRVKRENGDYDHAVRRLNEAKQQFNNAVSRFNSAKSKLNNAL